MVDRVTKFLRKLTKKERQHIDHLTRHIVAGVTTGLDLKKIKGHKSMYRARKGNMRVIYIVHSPGEIEIIDIAKRSEKTYKRL